MDLVAEDIHRYVHRNSSSEPELLQRLLKETMETMEMPQMLTGRIEGRLLKLLVQLSSARTILEIGMFTGYSALSMAEGLPKDGKLFTCEINPEAAVVAKRYFAESPHGKKIAVCMGPALDTIDVLTETFDLVFVDADKENYKHYFEAVLPKLRTGGLLVFDNMLWSGRVLDPQDEATTVLASLNEALASDSRVETVFLTVRDGIQLVRKK